MNTNTVTNIVINTANCEKDHNHVTEITPIPQHRNFDYIVALRCHECGVVLREFVSGGAACIDSEVKRLAKQHCALL